MNLISGKGETSSRLPAFSLFLPGSCPNDRHRRIVPRKNSADQHNFWLPDATLSTRSHTDAAHCTYGAVRGTSS
jgi:hypothetical protein